MLSVAWITLPVGLGVTLAVIGGVLFLSPVDHESYQMAVMLHGLAALIELASEPFYCLGLVRLRFRLRAVVDASAVITKSAVTLALVSLSNLPTALAFSLAQLAFSAVTLLLYVVFIGAEAFGGDKIEGPLWGAKEKEVLWMSGIFSLQALEKQFLAEGSKLVLVTVQSEYNQGVYGLVSNLGSLVVRTLFQPLEEIAFATFSRQQASIRDGSKSQDSSAKEGMTQLASILSVLVKTVLLLGLFSASFGPSFSYSLIRVVYGSKWSETEAPVVLAGYSIYIVLLAVNGITEAFIHAVLDSKGLQQTNYLLVLFSAAHIAALVVCIRASGATGLILADGINMMIRIATSLFYIQRHFYRSLPSFSLTSLMPGRFTLVAFSVACIVCLASEHVFLGPIRSSNSPSASSQFLKLATCHIGIGVFCLAAVGGILFRTERDLVRQIKQSIVKKS